VLLDEAVVDGGATTRLVVEVGHHPADGQRKANQRFAAHGRAQVLTGLQVFGANGAHRIRIALLERPEQGIRHRHVTHHRGLLPLLVGHAHDHEHQAAGDEERGCVSE
jgi:hypothetical protein